MIVILGILALLYLLYISSYEHMTTKDLLKKEDFHKKQREKKEPEPEPETAIKGPTISKKDKEDSNKPDPSDSGGGKSSVYPDIYGPDLLLTPGHKDSPVYDFSPTAEFPAGPNEPSPFLGDFSKILKA
jgi:hypothetical protein